MRKLFNCRKKIKTIAILSGFIFANNTIYAAICSDGDASCNTPGKSDQSISYAEQGKMAIYPKTYRSQGLADLNTETTEPADAILAQTSYLARVLIQANDIYPPSHVSSRSSGETYASTKLPLVYNIKALTQISSYRNALGAARTSAQSANPTGTSRNNVNRIARDWVEYHLNQYCDPLAGSIGTNGLNNCNIALNSIDAATVESGKQSGLTSWDLTAGRGLSGPYAADITASTLFSTKIQYPEAAMRFVFNSTNAFPQALGSKEKGPSEYTIPDKYLATFNGATVLKDDGYNLYMTYLESQSKLSLAQHAMMKILAERMSVDNIKIPVTKWDQAGNKTTSYEVTSHQGLLEFEANKRYQDPAWYDRVQQMPTPALLKEIAYMLAMQNSLDYKRYEQQQVQTALLASMVSDLSALSKVAKSIPSQEEQQQQANTLLNDYQSQLNNLFDRLR